MISGTQITLSPSSEAWAQVASTLSLPISSTNRFANADESRNVFMGTILKNGRRKSCSLGGQAQSLSFPRRLCVPLRCDRRYLSNGAPVAKHHKGFSVLHSSQHARCVTPEIRQSYGCHVLPPICTAAYRIRCNSSILVFMNVAPRRTLEVARSAAFCGTCAGGLFGNQASCTFSFLPRASAALSMARSVTDAFSGPTAP